MAVAVGVVPAGGVEGVGEEAVKEEEEGKEELVEEEEEEEKEGGLIRGRAS